jgi:hypothetical protein
MPYELFAFHHVRVFRRAPVYFLANQLKTAFAITGLRRKRPTVFFVQSEPSGPSDLNSGRWLYLPINVPHRLPYKRSNFSTNIKDPIVQLSFFSSVYTYISETVPTRRLSQNGASKAVLERDRTGLIAKLYGRAASWSINEDCERTEPRSRILNSFGFGLKVEFHLTRKHADLFSVFLSLLLSVDFNRQSIATCTCQAFIKLLDWGLTIAPSLRPRCCRSYLPLERSSYFQE